MANIKSSKKDIKRSTRRHAFNTSVKSSLKTYIKKAKKAVDSPEVDTVAATTRALSALDKAVSSGVIHKNQAARRKSRLQKAINKAQA